MKPRVSTARKHLTLLSFLCPSPPTLPSLHWTAISAFSCVDSSYLVALREMNSVSHLLITPARIFWNINSESGACICLGSWLARSFLPSHTKDKGPPVQRLHPSHTSVLYHAPSDVHTSPLSLNYLQETYLSFPAASLCRGRYPSLGKPLHCFCWKIPTVCSFLQKPNQISTSLEILQISSLIRLS